jgi:HSP20 family protein
LTISGEREAEAKKDDQQVHHLERAYGQFTRSVSLPKDAVLDDIKASLQDGVLTLTIAKREISSPESELKKIPIE